MSRQRRRDPEKRLLVLASTVRDATLTETVLERAEIFGVCFTRFNELFAALDAGVAAVLIPEEVLDSEEHERLAEWLARQPAWSDLPVLILARRGADSEAVARAMSILGNVTVIERPTRVAALISVARSALRARQRQYQIREHLVEREKTAAALLANDRRKDEFLAILAHELRNPLAPIRNSLHILRHLDHGGPEIGRISAMMERQVSHMVRLVDDLLEVSRITRDKIELRKERVTVASLVRAAVESSRPAIDAAGHQLDVEVPETPLVLEADPVRLAQVVSNLLNNAARYTDPGGKIRLLVRRRDDNMVEICVRDTGMGIPADMLPKVFDLFTQAHDATSRGQGGLGIGLTLVKRLTEMHGGHVRATSDGEGRGSEFMVCLPLAPVVEEVKPAREPEHASNLHRRRVLVVDDNVDAADSLGTLLELRGADTRVVYNGRDALEAWRTFRPAVVLLDLGMPGMDGHEVARRIRESADADDVTLIAMTGWGQESDRARTKAAGFDHHMIKPADLDALEALLVAPAGAPDHPPAPLETSGVTGQASFSVT